MRAIPPRRVLNQSMAWLAAVLFAALFLRSAVAETPVVEGGSKLADRAENFVRSVMTGHTLHVRGEMSKPLRSAMNDVAVQHMFSDIYARSGRPERVGEAFLSYADGGQVLAVVPIHFEKRSVAAHVTFEEARAWADVVAFSLHPFDPAENPQHRDPASIGAPPPMPPPRYAEQSLIAEHEVQITTEGGSLPAVLTLPNTASESLPVPGVLLISGMGALDEDGTIGRARPLRDISQGLATRGIAVLRYPKRTKARPETVEAGNGMTLEQAYLEDAREGIALLARQPEIDPSRLAIIGHDMGAFVAPIAARQTGVHRVALLAPPPYPIDRFLRLHARQWLEKAAWLTEEQRRPYEKAVDAADRLAEGDLGDDEVVLGIPGRIWNELYRQSPANDLGSLEGSFAILFASNDIYSPPAEMVSWRAAIDVPEYRSNWKAYDGLNHLFMPSVREEGAFPAGHVDRRVVEDLARFVHTGHF